ncbi:hypothetical protein GGR54DRAFT_2347 [Hypoxylon sp. NC1633]|nr:hypothetical protein GGR54DRAFT_2347 [Hypoxylon sp. NC1633]
MEPWRNQGILLCCFVLCLMAIRTYDLLIVCILAIPQPCDGNSQSVFSCEQPVSVVGIPPCLSQLGQDCATRELKRSSTEAQSRPTARLIVDKAQMLLLL